MTKEIILNASENVTGFPRHAVLGIVKQNPYKISLHIQGIDTRIGIAQTTSL